MSIEKVSIITRQMEVTERIQRLYLSDEVPWVVGYSGGKDSTATLQLIWNAIAELDADKRKKSVHVISTDTLVESPVVAAWVDQSLVKMKRAIDAQELPILVHKLTPEITDSFWVKLIGNGYPAPRQNLRWCTDRLKIRPSNKFITDTIAEHGEVILALGTRIAESQTRAISMKKYQKMRVRDWLSPSPRLTNLLTFTPIEDWDNDDVWVYLMQNSNPWGQSNKDLLTMYRGATEDGECPLVVDSDTPSCGSSRFGCWVCTMVKEDKSMKAMIQNDEEKVWMMPLLELRNEINKPNEKGFIDDRDRRDFRRMNGNVMVFNGRAVHGPYTKYYREHWLRRLLQVEKEVQKLMPEEFRGLKLISDEELRWIRKIWVLEKHEFDDSLPQIYEEVTGHKYPYMNDIKTTFGREEWQLLKKICGEEEHLFELQTLLLDISQQYMKLVRRRGILQEIEEAIRRCYYEGEEEAVKIQSEKVRRKEENEQKLEERKIADSNEERKQ